MKTSSAFGTFSKGEGKIGVCFVLQVQAKSKVGMLMLHLIGMIDWRNAALGSRYYEVMKHSKKNTSNYY